MCIRECLFALTWLDVLLVSCMSSTFSRLRNSLFFFSLNRLSVPLSFFSSEEVTICEIPGLYGKCILFIKHCKTVFQRSYPILILHQQVMKAPVDLDPYQHFSVCVFCTFILYLSHYNTCRVVSHFSFIFHLTCYLQCSLFYFLNEIKLVHMFLIFSRF